MNFSNLPFRRDSGQNMGVYKITFDNNYFYIGGSTWLRARLSGWKRFIKNGKVKNKNIVKILPSCKEIVFEVLEFILDKNQVKVREDFYIKNNWNNPLLLNRCPSAFDNTGLKLTTEEVAKLKLNLSKAKRHIHTPYELKQQLDIAIERGICQKVGKFSTDGILIEEYPSINNAAKAMNVDRDTLTDRFKGIGKKVRGFVFKKIDSNGNIIEPVILIRKTKKVFSIK